MDPSPTARPGCQVSVVGSRGTANVTVNSAGLSRHATGIGGAIVVPGVVARKVLLSATMPPGALSTRANPVKGQVVPAGSVHTPSRLGSTQDGQHVCKLLVKAFYRGTRKDPKTFTLRNVPTAAINSCKQLKQEIRAQLHEDIVKDFDVGYIQGSTPVCIRSSNDLMDIWDEVNEGKKIVLWCDGLKTATTAPKPSTSRKRKACIESGDDSDSSDDAASVDCKKSKTKRKSAQEIREEGVEETVSTLKDKHGKTYTQMQYRIWGEMYAGGMYANLEEPPNTSMFTRAGGTTPSRSRSDQGVAEALTRVANQISGCLTPVQASNRSPSLGTSPAKLIENRSKCYRQLTELNNLKSTGVLTEDEYQTEKDAIMATLKTLVS